MKRFMMVVVLVMVSGFMVLGQDPPAKNELHATVEQENQVKNGAFSSQVKIYLTYGGKNELGLYCWVQTGRYFSQTYCGPTYNPTSWLQVGVAVGVQTGPATFQAAGFVWIGKVIEGKMVSNLFVFEKGGNWYRNVTSVAINKRFTASLVSQRGKGTGLRGDVKLTDHFSVGAEYRFSKNPSLSFGFKLHF